ncbi:MAG: hypothetical protein D3915_09630 [Candidatus Electrothrix sp. AU1_5]|nr:hypothetical protein [Candidatus Electrothrix gigas]
MKFHPFFTTRSIRIIPVILIALCLALPAGSTADVLDRTTSAVSANKKTWRPPQLIGTDDVKSQRLKIAFNAAGDIIAVWVQPNNDLGTLWGNRYDAGQGWQKAQRIETNDTAYAWSSQVAMDGAGNVILAWREDDGGKIRARHYKTDRGWQKARLIKKKPWLSFIKTEDTGSAGDLQIAMNEAGNAVAVWFQSDESRSEKKLRLKYYTAGSGWDNGESSLINLGGNIMVSDLRVAIDRTGNAVAVWQQEENGIESLWANRYEVGKGWQQPKLIENNKRTAWNHEIAADKAGNIIVVWQQSRWDGYNIWANHYAAGSGWKGAQRINNNAPGCAEPPEIAFDGAGNALAIWSECQRGKERADLWFNRYVAGGGWQTAQRIDTDDTGFAYHPDIAFDGAGNALAAWSQCNGRPDVFLNHCNIWASRYVPGIGWEKVQPITIDADNAERPQIAVDTAGNALVIWRQTDKTRCGGSFCYDDSVYEIWAARYE